MLRANGAAGAARSRLTIPALCGTHEGEQLGTVIAGFIRSRPARR